MKELNLAKEDPTVVEGGPLEKITALLDETIRKIAEFPNPVELVNNMYGCHPRSEGRDYLQVVYGAETP